jgi:hypothetical protein
MISNSEATVAVHRLFEALRHRAPRAVGKSALHEIEKLGFAVVIRRRPLCVSASRNCPGGRVWPLDTGIQNQTSGAYREPDMEHGYAA